MSRRMRRLTLHDDKAQNLARLARARAREEKLRGEFESAGGGLGLTRPQVAAMFERMGLHHTRENDELFASFCTEEFTQMDRDKDDVVSFDEFVASHNRLREARRHIAHLNWALDHLIVDAQPVTLTPLRLLLLLLRRLGSGRRRLTSPPPSPRAGGRTTPSASRANC